MRSKSTRTFRRGRTYILQERSKGNTKEKVIFVDYSEKGRAFVRAAGQTHVFTVHAKDIVGPYFVGGRKQV